MQATVVQMAVAQSAPDFARSLAQLAAARDPQALEDSHQAVRRERSLVLSHQARGTYLKGFLDRVAGEALQVALDSAGQVPDETRSPEQARADALVAIARRACAGTGAPSGSEASSAGTFAGSTETCSTALAPGVGASSRPHLSLIVPAETFAALREHHLARGAVHTDATGGLPASPLHAAQGEVAARPADVNQAGARRGAADLGRTGRRGADRAADRGEVVAEQGSLAWHPVAAATLEDGTPVAMSELAQALCDCEITRIVVSAEGVPLDLGRTRRTYTGVHRRAVVARDRQCAWNGCQTSARWSQVHHIRWWDRDGGSTSIDNGVLLCDYHHHEVHRQDLTIERHAEPPGSVRRRRASGDPSDDEPPFSPMRYTFRRRRDGGMVNAPDGQASSEVEGRRSAHPIARLARPGHRR